MAPYHYALTRTKADVPPQRTEPQRTRFSTSWPTGTFEEWQAFDMRHLKESYGHVLEKDCPGVPPELPKVARSEDGRVDLGLFLGWNSAVIGETLQNSLRDVGKLGNGEVTQEVQMFPGTHDNPRLTKSFLGQHRIILDKEREDGISGKATLVFGAALRSDEWNGDDFTKAVISKEILNKKAWPVRALGANCQKHGCRYGYLQTENDTTVFRFTLGDNIEEEEDDDEVQERVPMTVAFRRFRWSYDHRDGWPDLTTDLALWWVAMLAGSGHHRMVRPDQLVEIDRWDEVDGTMERHYYSGHVCPRTQPQAQQPDHQPNHQLAD